VADISRAWLAHPAEEAVVAREVIVLKLDAEHLQLERRMADAKKLKGTALGEISLLELRLQRLRFAYAPRILWITAAAGVLIGGSSVVSLLRYGLSPWVAGAGAVAFAAGALLLLRDDLRRQRSAFAGRRAQLAAAVAEEIQILHAEVRSREAELAALEASRRRLIACQERLPAPI
jgi:hypothetical protein